MAYELIRPEDLLHLRIEVVNLELDASDPARPVLVAHDPAQTARLIVVFPPQTVAEPAYFAAAAILPADAGSPRPDPDRPGTGDEARDPPGRPHVRAAAAQIGHSSRLVFNVPAAAKIPYSLAGLLDWSRLELNVNPIAAIGPFPTAAEIAGAPDIRPPGATETAIELPYRLVISPTADVAWQHRGDPFVAAGRAELWHTRLQLRTPAGRVELTRERTAPLRAIWSPDYHPPEAPPPAFDDTLGRTAMDADDRRQIVVLTSAFRGYETDFSFLDLVEVTGLGAAAAATGAALAAAPGPGLVVGRRPARIPPAVAARPAAVSAVGVGLSRTVPYVPQPFDVEQLFLSALGGWLRSRGHWTPPREARPVAGRRILDAAAVLKALEFAVMPGRPELDRLDAPVAAAAARLPVAAATRQPPPYQLDLSEWIHVATLGRDHYVRIVYEGELWPFRHRAALIKVTERKFVETGGLVVAYLIQRMFIVVREPVKNFAAGDRGAPLKQVRLTTVVTPDLAAPEVLAHTTRSFWVRVGSGTGPADFRFHAVGTDLAGHPVDFTLPLLFVSLTDVGANLAPVAAAYNDGTPEGRARRELAVPGQKVFLAPQDAARSTDNTRFVTQTLNYVVNAAGTPAQLLRAEVKIPQVNELLGTDAATSIALHADYVAHGFQGPGEVFAQIVGPDLKTTVLGVTFSAAQAGGFATPNLGVSSLTRALGPVAGRVEDAIADTFDPGKFFPPGTAELFGTFDLGQLLLAAGSLGDSAPKMHSRTADDGAGGKLVISSLDWAPQVKTVDLTIAAFTADPARTKLKINGTIQKPVHPGGTLAGEVKSEFTGTLTAFEVSILKSVLVHFTEFSFTAKSGQKPGVRVKLSDPPVTFAGDLAFVEDLQKAIPPDLLGDGPSLDITPAGIRAGFDLALPPLAIGVFALKDVSLGAALTLPFLEGKPVFDFNISQRAHPFLLTVSLFGGGGFFHLQLDTAGMKALEASLEFGAAASIDIGVASGEVHIMAGIYFSLQRKEGTTDLAATLTGYLRLGGSLSVLGLIKISVEFNLSFTYEDPGKAYGRATLTVHVEVLFFSKSVELTVERAFGGAGDPHFLDMFTADTTWSDYARAFA